MKEILTKVRELMSRGHLRHQLCNVPENEPRGQAARYCLRGAICEVLYDDPWHIWHGGSLGRLNEVESFLRVPSVVDFNNCAESTDDVLDLLDRAIERCQP